MREPVIFSKYERFYLAFLNSKGEILYPSSKNEVEIIKYLIRNINSNHTIFLDDKKAYYKVEIKQEQFNGEMVQVMMFLNVTDYYNNMENACVDEVTHLNNRKVSKKLLNNYIEIAYRNNEDFSIAMGDLDCFKNVNDTYGHSNGDIVLSEVSRILFSSTRQEKYRRQDIVARLGGDEFGIILKNTQMDMAIERIEEIRKKIEMLKVPLFSVEKNVEYINAGTMSFGLYHVTHEELEYLFSKGYNADEIRATLVERCDSALYISKNSGRNRVTLYEKDNVKKLIQ